MSVVARAWIHVPAAFDPFGAPEQGLWCPRCLHASGLRLTGMYTIGVHSVLRTLEVCQECGAVVWDGSLEEKGPPHGST